MITKQMHLLVMTVRQQKEVLKEAQALRQPIRTLMSQASQSDHHQNLVISGH